MAEVILSGDPYGALIKYLSPPEKLYSTLHAVSLAVSG